MSDTARAVQLFHALSDETRVGIIEMLESGERCVCDLQDTLNAAQSRLSFHLRVLKDAGIVTDRREGRWSYYELNRDAQNRYSRSFGRAHAARPLAEMCVVVKGCFFCVLPINVY